MDKRPVAVFDIDGTVFRSSLFLELLERLVERGILPLDLKEVYHNEQKLWLDRQGEYDAYVEKAVEAFLGSVKGVSFDEVSKVATELVGEKKNRVYRYTRDLIKSLKEKDYFLLAISHSPRFVLDEFCKELGFDKMYGFFYETGPSGNFTGEVADIEVIRNKAAILQRAVRKENLTLEDSIGVGDTESDIPMLEMVEKPIAFNPNRKLLEHARKRGWKVVVERKDVTYEL